MKRFLVCSAIVVSLLGCAGVAPPPTGTPEDAAALCIRSITTTRQAATALLRAGKIDVAKNREIQNSLDASVPGCREMANIGVPRP